MKAFLRESLVAALDSIVAVLGPYVRSGKVPREPVTVARCRKEGGFAYHHYHRRSYAGLCGRLATVWRRLPTVKAAIERLSSDADVCREFDLVGFGNPADYVERQIFDQFIYMVFARTQRWPPTTLTVDRLFSEFEGYLLGGTVSYQAFVPLENFECESRSLLLGPGITVRKLTNREKEDLLTSVLNRSSPENEMEVLRHKFAATIDISWKKGTAQAHHQSSVERLLTALRLFKTGGVGANVGYRREIRWQPGHAVGRGVGRHIFTLPVTGPMYVLKRSEADELPTFWRWLYERPLSYSTAVAVRWFNHGYQDWILEDRIISFVTGFESLFVRRKDGKGKQLRSRIARLLTNASGRPHVEEKVGSLWDLRSDVIHAQPYSEVIAQRLVATAEEYLRESIRRYIDLERTIDPNSRENILMWIDDPDVDAAKQKFFPKWRVL